MNARYIAAAAHLPTTGPGVTAEQIAHRLGVSASYAREILVTLERQGWARRRRVGNRSYWLADDHLATVTPLRS